ncbi:MAG: N-acetylmuramoyl-L-alanine amidase, partial [bacterium]
MLRSLWIIFFLVSSGFSVSVCIDPGHGGTDAGALGEYIQEKDANLMVALSCRDYLRNYTAVTVGLTRETDITLSLAERTEYANSRGFNWFISIHHNAYNGQVQGTETFRHTTQSETSWAGQLQSAVHPWLIWAFGYTDRGKKQADFYVLRNTVMPAILGE